LGRVAGIPLYLNPSWFLVFGLASYGLATTQLPLLAPGEAGWVYWLLGPLVAAIFFASIVAHELGHSLVSRAYGLPVRSITLHLLGGVAQLGAEVRSAREEFWIAVAGPLVSVALAGLFWGVGLLLDGVWAPLAAALGLLALLNVSVVLFNLLPGFPLDGGRVLRSVVWGVTGDYRRASRVAAGGGRLVGFLLILLGLGLALGSGDLGSLWLALIGVVLLRMARFSYAQAIVHDTLQRTPVAAAMIRLIAVPAELTLDELYAGYVRTTGREHYMLESGGRPVGVITPEALARIPWPQWSLTRLAAVMRPLDRLPEVSVGASAGSALSRMEELKSDLLGAVEGGLIVGLVTRERILGLLAGAGRPA
jgi:Zn-dependent protease